MSKLFWCILCLGAYLWVISSGNDQFILDQGKALVQSAQKWFEGADLNFQLKEHPTKKKSRRWD